MFATGMTRMSAIVGMFLTLATAAPGVANINLKLTGVPEKCASRQLAVDLYAISDNQGKQSIGAMDVILKWDPDVLELRGIDQNGAYQYNWLFSGFPDDSGLDGLNNTWADGDALYTALAQLGGPPAYAPPPPGLLVTTFLFKKLRVGSPTEVKMLPQFGKYSRTVVYDGFIPGKVVTGTLENAGLTPSAKGDLNCDGVVNNFDIDPFVLAITDPQEYQRRYPNCNLLNADCNCDGVANNFDIDPFVVLLTTP